MIKQIRFGIKKAIDQNRVRVTLNRFPLVTNPITGEQVRNPAGTKTTHDIYGRIAHEASRVPDDRLTPAGMSTTLSRVLIVDADTTIIEHDTFTWNGGSWEVGPVDPVKMGGVTVAYQSILQEA